MKSERCVRKRSRQFSHLGGRHRAGLGLLGNEGGAYPMPPGDPPRERDNGAWGGACPKQTPTVAATLPNPSGSEPWENEEEVSILTEVVFSSWEVKRLGGATPT